MCGICGFFDPLGQMGITSSQMQAMVASLHHRGPDETGVEYRPHFGLAIARLSIVDVSEGHQPYFNEKRDVVAVFNGEIYNFPQLRAGLLSRGHHLNSRADGEVIVHLYEELGERFVERLNGMFAIALVDLRLGKFLLARDRLGIKPMYFARKDSGIVFASQPAALFPSGQLEPTLNLAALDQYLTFEFLPNPACIYAGAQKLPPAHLLQLSSSDQGLPRPYWRLQPQSGSWESDESRSHEAWLDELDERLRESVRSQLISDVPLGMFLSGGLDSSTVTALAQQASGGRFKTFSVGFRESTFDESQGAEEVARLLGSQHYSVVLESDQVDPLLSQLLDSLDEPLADPAAIPTFLLSRLAREHVTVVLSGEGADELFGGYPTYLAHQLSGVASGLAPLVGMARGIVNRIPASTSYMSWEFKAKRFFAHVDNRELGGAMRHQLWMGAAEPDLRTRFYSAAMKQALGGADAFLPLAQMRPYEGPRGWPRYAWQDLQFYLAEGLLVKLDRATMATSLEGRVPYLDHTLVEFALSMPPSLKYRMGKDKWLLRRLASRYLTGPVAQRRKKGFGLPLTQWLKSELREAVEQALAFLQSTGIFEGQALAALWEEHRLGRCDRRKELWTLLVLARWWQRWKVRLP